MQWDSTPLLWNVSLFHVLLCLFKLNRTSFLVFIMWFIMWLCIKSILKVSPGRIILEISIKYITDITKKIIPFVRAYAKMLCRHQSLPGPNKIRFLESLEPNKSLKIRYISQIFPHESKWLKSIPLSHRQHRIHLGFELSRIKWKYHS